VRQEAVVGFSRLLVYSRRFPPDAVGGAETVIAALVAQAQREVEEVRLVAGFQRARGLLPLDCAAIDLRGSDAGIGAWLRRRLVASTRLGEEIRRFRPDVVLSNAVELPRLDVPSVVIAHDFAFGRAADAPREPRDLLRRAGWWWTGRRATLAVAVSEVTRAALADLGWPADRIRVVRGGVDLARFSPAGQSADDAAWVGLPPGLRVAVIGRLVPEKGVEDAIAGLAGALAGGLTASMVIAGSVVEPAFVDRLRAAARGLPVRFLLDPDQVAPVYRAADVALFPTRVREGLGLAAIEAMACGLPVVHADDPAVVEATDGLGVVVPRRAPAAISAALRRLAGGDALRAQLGAAGRALCEARYGWETVFRGYGAVLDEAVSLGARRTWG
jgi:glycosyltransferase involved in cell wall biosynthesis